jgi:hypothetical protein
LGVEIVGAVNDGGLAVKYDQREEEIEWQHHVYKRPVLTLEVCHDIFDILTL